jgi:hypothetical protein
MIIFTFEARGVFRFYRNRYFLFAMLAISDIAAAS